jgi:uroporphyrinogen decarboxylase
MLQVAKNREDVFEEMHKISVKIKHDIALGLKAGAHGIIVADDIAYTQGPFIAALFVQEYLMPLWQEQVNGAHHLKAPVFFTATVISIAYCR